MQNRKLNFISSFVFIYLGLFLLIPFTLLVLYGFIENGAFTLNNLTSIFKDKDFYDSFLKSIFLAAISSALTTTLALALVYLMRRTKVHNLYKNLLKNLVVLPMLLPSISYGFAIIYVFGANGLVKRLIGTPLIDVYSYQGLILGYMIYTIGPIFMIINNSFRYLDENLYTVSKVLNDTKWQTFKNVTFQGMKTGLINAFFVGFSLAFSDFGLPMALNYDTLAKYLYKTTLGSVPQIGKGAIIGVILLMVPLINYLIVSYYQKKYTSLDNIQKVQPTENKKRDFLLCGVTFIYFSIIILVFSVIFIVPFVKNWPYDFSFSLDIWNKNTLKRISFYRNVVTTFEVAIYTAILGTIITFFTALVTTRSTNKFKKILDTICLMPNIIPGMSLGLGYLLIVSNYRLSKYAMITMILLNSVHFFTSPYLLFKNSLEKINDNLEDISYVLGDSYLKTVIKIIIPNLKGPFVDIMSYLFISSFTTMSALIFVSTYKVQTLSLSIKSLEQNNQFNLIFALSIVILFINLIVNNFKNYYHKKIEK
ncbi:ABC transporter permease subunit [Cetobacterium sp. 2A]|uniref:ABC transporter permease subunit n=1 Tax=Cetobacterium sp. 2A TaxID=2754723 RepID=UPI00163D2C23|nr:ABC transporter permease subunit [Cetobacterium sp. 2A]MBC2854952.1 ABC transporter permease subunit [Cetobacterium sp. 2A]